MALTIAAKIPSNELRERRQPIGREWLRYCRVPIRRPIHRIVVGERSDLTHRERIVIGARI